MQLMLKCHAICYKTLDSPIMDTTKKTMMYFIDIILLRKIMVFPSIFFDTLSTDMSV